MESNREEAERCILIAKAALDSGDKRRARKFLSIAQRLRPEDVDVADLAAKLQSDEQEDSSKASTTTTTSSSKRNGEYEPEVKDTATSAGNAEPSPEQVEIVVRINRTVDYYEILGLKKDCTEEDLRKAYRKLSLKIHPDKNKAKGAEEAFKSVSRAFQCLSNAELRERYDRYGPEEARRLSHQPQGEVRRRRQNEFFHEDGFDPEEFFQAFFFGGQGQARNFQRQQQQPFVRTQGPPNFNMTGLIHLVLIFIVIVLSSYPMSQPSYFSLERSSPYVYPMSTNSRGVPYYVKSASFDQENPLGSKVRNQVEAQVERDYRDILLHNCRVELNLRAWGKISETPNCKKLESFQHVQHVY